MPTSVNLTLASCYIYKIHCIFILLYLSVTLLTYLITKYYLDYLTILRTVFEDRFEVRNYLKAVRKQVNRMGCL